MRSSTASGSAIEPVRERSIGRWLWISGLAIAAGAAGAWFKADLLNADTVAAREETRALLSVPVASGDGGATLGAGDESPRLSASGVVEGIDRLSAAAGVSLLKAEVSEAKERSEVRIELKGGYGNMRPLLGAMAKELRGAVILSVVLRRHGEQGNDLSATVTLGVANEGKAS